MIALVTGAGGFLGRRLAQRLLADGHIVRGVDHVSVPPSLAGHSGLSWIRRDLAREELSTDEIEKVDTVFHLAGATLGAGQDELLFCIANEATTIGLLKACSGKVGKIVHASSQVVYGNVDNLSISEDFPLDGYDSAYACSKLNAENWLRWFQYKDGGACVVLRFCGFIEGGGIIDYMIDQALHDKAIELFSNGKICRDYLAVDKGIDALVAASRYQGGGRFNTLNIGSGQAITTLELANMVCAVTGSSSTITTLDKPATRANFVFNVKKAREELGFEPGVLVDTVRSYIQDRIRLKTHGEYRV